MQWRAAIQITGAFQTSPTSGIETIVGLISIHLHLQKISSRHQLRTASLPSNHAINLLLESRHSKKSLPHCLSLEKMTTKQWLKIKSSILDTNNCLNGILPSFNKKLLFGFRIVDNFPNHFSFYPVNHKNKESREAYL